MKDSLATGLHTIRRTKGIRTAEQSAPGASGSGPMRRCAADDDRIATPPSGAAGTAERYNQLDLP